MNSPEHARKHRYVFLAELMATASFRLVIVELAVLAAGFWLLFWNEGIRSALTWASGTLIE